MGARCSWEAGVAGLFFFLPVVSGPLTLQWPLHEVFPHGFFSSVAGLFMWWLGSQKQKLPGLLEAQAQD